MLKYIRKIPSSIYKILSGKRSLKQTLNLLKYRLSKRSIKLNYKPIYLTILPIHRCNMACKMCLTHSKEIADNKYRHKFFDDMSFETFRDILNKFPESLAVGFMGNGEPLLNKDIFKMIDYAEEKAKMHTAMISNGLVLRQNVDKVLSSKLSNISISINGHNADEFSRMTGQPSYHFDTLINAAKELIAGRNEKKSKLKIYSSIIIDKENLSKLQGMIDFSVSVGFDHTSCFNILPLFEKRSKEISIYDDPRSIEILKNVKIPEGADVSLPIPLDGKPKNNICPDFFTCLNVDGAGNVGGCNRQRFNIHESGKYTDKNVWNNEYFRKEREKFINPSKELDEPCRVCFANSTYMEHSIDSIINE